MKRIHLLGFDFVSGDMSEVVAHIRDGKYKETSFKPFVITPNADQTLQFDKSRELRDFFTNSFLVLPDGFPIVAYSRIIGRQLRGRLAGSDLFPLVWKMAIQDKREIFIVVPTDAVGRLLQQEYPAVSYYVPGLINIEKPETLQAEVDNIVRQLKGRSPDYLMIGLGFPKQELLARSIYQKLGEQDSTLYMLLGASFEFYLGLKNRAPRWMQKSGLEWLHRLLSEPGRLWRRYTIGNLMFLNFLVKQYFREERKPNS